MPDNKGPFAFYTVSTPSKPSGGFSLWKWFKMVGLVLLGFAALNLLASLGLRLP